MWRDIHQLVVHVLCSELVRVGLLIGETEDLIRLGVYRAFYFHGKKKNCYNQIIWFTTINQSIFYVGTGHSVGIDCHDVGG